MVKNHTHTGMCGNTLLPNVWSVFGSADPAGMLSPMLQPLTLNVTHIFLNHLLEYGCNFLAFVWLCFLHPQNTALTFKNQYFLHIKRKEKHGNKNRYKISLTPFNFPSRLEKISLLVRWEGRNSLDLKLWKIPKDKKMFLLMVNFCFSMWYQRWGKDAYYISFQHCTANDSISNYRMYISIHIILMYVLMEKVY